MHFGHFNHILNSLLHLYKKAHKLYYLRCVVLLSNLINCTGHFWKSRAFNIPCASFTLVLKVIAVLFLHTTLYSTTILQPNPSIVSKINIKENKGVFFFL